MQSETHPPQLAAGLVSESDVGSIHTEIPRGLLRGASIYIRVALKYPDHTRHASAQRASTLWRGFLCPMILVGDELNVIFEELLVCAERSEAGRNEVLAA